MKMRLTIPAGFNPFEALPPRLQLYADEARYFLDRIVMKTVQRRADSQGYVRLHSDLLCKVISSRRFKGMVDSLRAAGGIDVDDYYLPGAFCKGYRLSAAYLDGPFVESRPVDPALQERIRRSWEFSRKIQAQRSLPIHARLAEAQQHLRLEGDVEPILKSLEPRSRMIQDVLVRNLRSLDYSFTIGRTGRVFNSITGLKRELRPFLRLCGEPLGNVDLSCAQPALLALLMRMEVARGGVVDSIHATSGWKGCRTLSLSSPPSSPSLPFSSERFASLACSGGLYDVLADASGLDRRAAKKQLLSDVLAPRFVYPCPLRAAFEREFPEVAEFIKRVNRSGLTSSDGSHGNLIRALQALEAELVIELVCPLLVDRIPIMTIHDAIFCRERDVPLVEQAFRQVFARLVFEMRLKAEPSGSDSFLACAA
jgi:hypothetical protein